MPTACWPTCATCMKRDLNERESELIDREKRLDLREGRLKAREANLSTREEYERRMRDLEDYMERFNAYMDKDTDERAPMAKKARNDAWNEVQKLALEIEEREKAQNDAQHEF